MTSRCPASSRCSSAGVGSPRTSATSHANDAPPAVLGVCAKQRNNPKHTSSSSRACFVKQLCADVSLPQPHLHNTSRHELERIRRRRPRACYIRNKVNECSNTATFQYIGKVFLVFISRQTLLLIMHRIMTSVTSQCSARTPTLRSRSRHANFSRLSSNRKSKSWRSFARHYSDVTSSASRVTS